jgi:hypothetical protein
MQTLETYCAARDELGFFPISVLTADEVLAAWEMENPGKPKPSRARLLEAAAEGADSFQEEREALYSRCLGAALEALK